MQHRDANQDSVWVLYYPCVPQLVVCPTLLVVLVLVVCPNKAGTPGQKYLQVVALGTPAWKGTTTTPRSVVGQCG